MKKNRKLDIKRLLHRYRLVVMDEDTFEERISLRLNRFLVFVVFGLGSILLVMGTILLISFTPLKEYIPGYISTSLRQKATDLAFRADSLEYELNVNSQYIESMRKALVGESISESEYFKESVKGNIPLNKEEININHIKEDSLLREEVALEDKYNIFFDNNLGEELILFEPLKGIITEEFNLEKEHYGIDIVAEENTPVLAIAEGHIIFVEWTLETGYVVIIEHGLGLISVYKHNNSIFKQQGDFVESGEIIASVGNTGEYSTGPHLHFEIWKDGVPLNPKDYILFED